jgi:serine/threonine protein kinase
VDGSSPLESYLAGEIREDELLAETERILTTGSESDRTILIRDWRTKSGRIRSASTREKLDAKINLLTWVPTGNNGTRPPPQREPLRPGITLANRFVIDAVIGSGGMGTVFKARDLRREEARDRQPFVALKTLNVEVLRRDDSLRILQREARKAQELSHPNIISPSYSPHSRDSLTGMVQTPEIT